MAAGGFEPESVRIAEKIRTEIIDGTRPPGSKLVERDLALDLGVSRLPVRDAIKTLETEGMVRLRPRSWAVVREFTATDIADLQEVRVGLESMTFRLAARRHTREGLERLREIVKAELAATQTGDGAAARRAGAEFHECVNRFAGNDLLLELHGVLSARMRWLLVQHDDLQAIGREHQELLEAIAVRDEDRVALLVSHHLATSKRSIARLTADLSTANLS
ncbi:GntR family transcriptional regulator [Glutamicibacter endophyticus]